LFLQCVHFPEKPWGAEPILPLYWHKQCLAGTCHEVSRKVKVIVVKRTEALAAIKWAGWHDDASNAAVIATQKEIGKAAHRKAFFDGKRMKERGEPCGCALCGGKK
jgi:hypothetical protein